MSFPPSSTASTSTWEDTKMKSLHLSPLLAAGERAAIQVRGSQCCNLKSPASTCCFQSTFLNFYTLAFSFPERNTHTSRTHITRAHITHTSRTPCTLSLLQPLRLFHASQSAYVCSETSVDDIVATRQRTLTKWVSIKLRPNGQKKKLQPDWTGNRSAGVSASK